MLHKLLALAGLGLALSAGAQTEPIRVGFMTVDSGPNAFYQAHLLEPAKFAVEQFNAQGGVLGRKLELVVQAHSGTPAGALATASKLVQQEKVSFLTGFNTSAMSLALAPRLAGLNAILIDGSTASDELTTKQCFSNYFRGSANDGMTINVLKPLMKSTGIKTWHVIAPDFALGHDFTKRFRAAAEEMGGTVVTALLAPLGTVDFGSYISQLSAKPADGLMVLIIGSDAIAFAKQQKQFGLFAKFKAILSSNFTNDVALPAQGDTTVGVFSSMSYSPEMPGAKNAAFVKAWQERFKRPPSYIEADNYQTMELLKAAIEQAGTTDVAAVRKALAGLKTNTVLGDVEMRAADHQLVRPMGVVEVVAAGEGKGRMALRRTESGAAITPAPVINCD